MSTVAQWLNGVVGCPGYLGGAEVIDVQVTLGDGRFDGGRFRVVESFQSYCVGRKIDTVLLTVKNAAQKLFVLKFERGMWQQPIAIMAGDVWDSQPVPSAEERIAQLEARMHDAESHIEWLRGIALERKSVEQDVKMVREALDPLPPQWHAVREAFERLVTRLTEPS